MNNVERMLHMRPCRSQARAYADSFMPTSPDGKLYRVVDLTSPLAKWGDGAPITKDAFVALGINIGLYVWLNDMAIRGYLVLAIIALVPIIYNCTGDNLRSYNAFLWVC